VGEGEGEQGRRGRGEGKVVRDETETETDGPEALILVSIRKELDRGLIHCMAGLRRRC
jgi:hypothetical protein